jgi:DNA-binding NtrC family response regulator
MRIILHEKIDCILADSTFSRGNTGTFLHDLNAEAPRIPVILFADSFEDSRLRKTVPEGLACRTIRNPFHPEELLDALADLEKGELQDVSGPELSPEEILGILTSYYFFSVDLLDQLVAAEETGMPILLVGKKGSGKRWAARWIHHSSGGKLHAFKHIAASTLSVEKAEALLSEWLKLFSTTHPIPSTYYFHDIHLLSEDSCHAFLELMEVGFAKKNGSRHKSLLKTLASSTMPSERWIDLSLPVREIIQSIFHRVIVFPSVQEKKKEIEKWANALLSLNSKRYNLPESTLSSEAVSALRKYHWPGNFVEFRGVIAKAQAISGGRKITAEDTREAILENPFRILARHEEDGPEPVLSAPEAKPDLFRFDPHGPSLSLENVFIEMAHEIKNPLVSIQTFTQLLHDKFNDDEFRNYYSRIVKEDVQRIDNLLSEMVEFSRVGNPIYSLTDVREALENELSEFKEAFQGKEIQIRWRGEKHPLEMETDGSLLRYAFRNIIIDSLNKIPKGGYFQIEAGLVPVRSRGEGSRSRDLHLKIEYPFSLEMNQETVKTLHPRKSLRRELFGLRLTIADQILLKLGGKLVCEDTLEGKTKITVKSLNQRP